MILSESQEINKQSFPKKAYFHLPGLFGHLNLYNKFLFLYTNERDKFNDWVEVDALYGNPSKCIWGGGRRVLISEDELDVLDLINTYDIGAALTFSNLCLREEHLNDVYCNYLLKLFDNPKNYIISASPILEEYIKASYPNYTIISSTTKCIEDNTEMQDISNNYNLICLDENYNHNDDFLKQLKHKENYEILLNPVCKPYCKYRKEHYTAISEIYLYEYDSRLPDFVMSCECQGFPFYKRQKQENFIKVEDIYDKYISLGFEYFKIEGRGAPDDDLVEILSYYLVKPEYQLEIKERLYGL